MTAGVTYDTVKASTGATARDGSRDAGKDGNVTESWRNRIVGSGEESPDQLLANPLNWRVHPQMQQEALAGVLSEVGWVQQVIVNQRTGHLIDGHLRVSLALRRNEPTVPVLYVDLDPEEEALILATLDPLAAMATADAEKLDELLRDVRTGEAAVQAMLADLADAEGIYLDEPPSLDELAEQYGEHQDEAFWPRISLKVPPDVYERFEALMDRLQGEPHERFARMLDAAEDRYA